MGVLDGPTAAAGQRFAADGDFTIVDGIAICNRCNTPRQTAFEILGKVELKWHACKCLEEKESTKVDPERIASMQKRGNIDPRCTFDRAEDTEQIKKCRQYVEKWEDACECGAGLILWGNVGTGKTFAAHCIANELIRKDVPVFSTSLSKVINAGFDKTEVLKRIRETPLVIFDDLGAERASEYALEQVFLLVDERYRTGKPLIITTNLLIDEIRGPKDIERQRIYDRITERCVPLRFVGDSRRAKTAAKTLEFMKTLFGQ